MVKKMMIVGVFKSAIMTIMLMMAVPSSLAQNSEDSENGDLLVNNSCLTQIAETFEFNSRFSSEIEKLLKEKLRKQDDCDQFIESLKSEVSHFVEWAKWKQLDSIIRRQLASNLLKTLHEMASIKVASKLAKKTTFEYILASNLFATAGIFDKQDPLKMTCAQHFQSILQVVDSPLSEEFASYLNNLELNKCMTFVQEVKRSILNITKLTDAQWGQFPEKVRKTLIASVIPMLYVHSIQEVSHAYSQKNITLKINQNDLFFDDLFAKPTVASSSSSSSDMMLFEEELIKNHTNESSSSSPAPGIPLFSLKSAFLLVGFVVVMIMVLLGLRALDMIPKF